MARGGKRPGAGRPKGVSHRASEADKAGLEARAREHTKTALDALVEVAKGAESDAARVSAASALLDRGYGKPRQQLEHSGADGGPLTVQVIRFGDDQNS